MREAASSDEPEKIVFCSNMDGLECGQSTQPLCKWDMSANKCKMKEKTDRDSKFYVDDQVNEVLKPISTLSFQKT